MKDISVERFGKTLKVGTATIFCFLASLCLIGCEKEEPKWDTKFPTDTSGVIKQYDTPFKNVPEISDIVLYEVNIRAFSNSGDLAGIEKGLDSLKTLGVNVVWLMPIYEVGELKSVGSPYAVRNYKKISDDLGNLEDLRSLVKEAHKLDMAVILDWVANHTSWDNEWISNKSWYAQNETGEIIQPPGTNWTDVAELNYDNPNMRAEMIQALKYWTLEANIDGFRCDYAHGVPADFWKDAIDTLRSLPDRELIMFAESEEKELLNSDFDMIFGWNYYGKLKDVISNNHPATDLITTNNSDYAGLSEDKYFVRWITNHDQHAWDGTPIDIFNGEKGSMAGFVLSAYMPGIPLLYSGQEVGMTKQIPFFLGQTVKIDWNNNPSMKAEYKELLRVYNESSALRKGNFVSFSTSDVAIFKRSFDSEEVLVIVNVRNNQINLDIPSSLINTTWYNEFNGSDITFESTISLEPYSYLILRK